MKAKSGNGYTVFTDDFIVRAVEALGQSETVSGACEILTRAARRQIVPRSLRWVFADRGLESPSFYLGNLSASPFAPPSSVEPAAQTVSAAPEEVPPVEDIEIPVDWQDVMPYGQRLRGNSTLLNADGSTDRKWVKTERDSDDPPACEPVPAGHHVTKVSSLLDGQGKVRAQWIQAPRDKVEAEAAFWAACEEHAAKYRGLAGIAAPPNVDTAERLLTVYPLGDPHIGLLAWGRETGADFDLRIAEDDLLACVDMLVDRAPPSKRALLANLGDFFHAQNDENTTPRGKNHLDVDGRIRKVLEVGLAIQRRLIEKLLAKHELVQVVNVRGNHDINMAHMLSVYFQEVYADEPRVTVSDNANPYTYVEFGKNLIGIAHGDGAKKEQLPGIMATDRPEAWGRTLYRYVYQGHEHHKFVKEFPGCMVEVFRTLATADAWAHWKGYRSGSSLDCITLDAEFGEVTRSTVDLRLARAGAAA